MNAQLNFAYPWWLTYGQLVVTAVALPLWVAAQTRRWPRVVVLIAGALTLWSIAAFVAAHFYLNVNGRLPLPTETFLASGGGRVLDMGAGTGRSTLMVLEKRPQSTVVALDLFGESYKQHFGTVQTGQERLAENLRAAGVLNRATIQTGDMRALPFDPATFDGVVSTYAIDHLRGDGVDSALREASRVLRPGGDFLLMVLMKDSWLNFTFGPLLLHSGTRGPEWWTKRVSQSGFHVIQQGTRPGTLWILARKQ